jgi:phage internal scaffolding protein
MSRENRKKLVFNDVSRTDQSYKKITDVNLIVKRYRKTGVLPNSNGPRGYYGDVSNAPDLTEAFEVVQRASEAFFRLPADIRKQLGNDPTELHSWLLDPKNRKAAAEAGLMEELVIEEGTQLPDTDLSGVTNESSSSNDSSNSGGSNA